MLQVLLNPSGSKQRLVNSIILGDLIPCSLVDVYTCFGETYCSHLQDNTIRRARNKEQSEYSCLLLVCSPKSMILKM
jgi:hypothetical protein